MPSEPLPPDQVDVSHRPEGRGAVTRLASLDGLRGLAALVVLLNHAVQLAPATDRVLYGEVGPDSASWWFTWTPLRVLWAGEEAVLVFFVLSGFVLTLPWLEGRLRWTSYYPRRLVRLYVPVWASLAIAAASILLVSRDTEGRSAYLQDRAAATLGHLRHEPFLLVPGERVLNGPLWSLRYEVLFSLLLPLYLLFAARLRRHVSVQVALLLAVIGLGTATASSPLRYLPVFGLGVLLAFHASAVQRLAERVQASRRPGLVWGGLALASVVLLTAEYTADALPVPTPGDAAGPFLGASLALVLAMHWPAARRVLEGPLWQWLGLVSFSLYVVHEPVILTIAYALPASTNPWLLVVGVLPPALVAGALLHRSVERPSLDLARRAGEVADRARGRVPRPAERGRGHRRLAETVAPKRVSRTSHVNRSGGAMTTNSGDAERTPVATGGTAAPYEIGLATDDARGTDETGPKPLDTEREDKQVRGDT